MILPVDATAAKETTTSYREFKSLTLKVS